MHNKSFNVDVNENLSDEFSNQISERGYTKYRAIEGALRAFMALSPAEQVQWMSQGNSVQPQGKQEAPQTIRKVLKAIAKKAKEQGGEAELPGTTGEGCFTG